MKQIIFALLIFLVITQTTLSNTIITEVKNQFEVEINGATFTIDKRIELFYIIAMLADYPRINGYNLSYKDDIRIHFSPYLSHEIFSFIKKIGRKWYLDTPTHLMLFFTEDFELRTDAQLPDNLIAINGGEDQIRKLQLLLQDFALKSNYAGFIENHSNFYNTILTTTAYNLRNFDEIRRMEDYYKLKNYKYTIILNMLGRGNFGPQVSTAYGKEIYAIIQPEAQLGDIPAYTDNRSFNNLIWHEFGHSFINPIVDNYIDEIEKYAWLYEPIGSSMKSQAYGNWITTVREHLTRAVTCRLAAMRFGEDIAYLNYERYEIGHRFIYVKSLLDKLKEYEQSKDKYNSFEDFFPELLSVFKTITPDMIDELQTKVDDYRKPTIKKIPEIGSFDENNLVIITPTKEENPQLQKQLTDFIINDYCWDKKIKIITDSVANNANLSNLDLIVIGTIKGNTFLSKHFKELPIVVNKDKIIADKEYIGENLQLITGWINPFNNKRTMMIYTAQNAKDLIRCNRIPYKKGITIAQSNKVIHYGEFKNPGRIWLCE